MSRPKRADREESILPDELALVPANLLRVGRRRKYDIQIRNGRITKNKELNRWARESGLRPDDLSTLLRGVRMYDMTARVFLRICRELKVCPGELTGHHAGSRQLHVDGTPDGIIAVEESSPTGNTERRRK